MVSKMTMKWSKHITSSQVQQLIRAERDTKKAVLIFDSATAEYSNGFRHDHDTYGLIISRLASANQFKSAEELLNRMKEEKCNVSEDIFLSLCRAYGRVHKPLHVLRIFHKMKEFHCEISQKSYVTVFSLLVDENQLKMAHKFYKYMKEVGVPPCIASTNVLIKAFCKSSKTMDSALRIFRQMPDGGLKPDSYTYGTLVNGLCRLGRIDTAKELFKEMDEKGCSPTVVTYSSLIHGLCLSNNLLEAVEVFAEMIRKGIEPNVVTYTSLMDGLCKGGQSSKAMDLLEKMCRKRHIPNIKTYSTLVSGLCQDGKILEALEILDRMKLQGCKPDAGLYSKLIIGLCDSFKFQEAANILDEMILSGISPNPLTQNLHVKMHNTVVRGLCTENFLNRAFQVYLSMRTRNISTDAETFNFLIGCFCKKGDLHKAARIVNEMMFDGCIPHEVTWTSVLSSFWNRKKVREAAESVQAKLASEFYGSKIEVEYVG